MMAIQDTGYSNSTIQGVYFEVLSDSGNSNNVISDFKVSVLLAPCDNSGNITISDAREGTVVTTYTVSEFHQMSARNYSNLDVDLSQVFGLQDGQYRVSIWVDSEDDIPSPTDDPGDNLYPVTLNSNGDPASSIINYSSSATAVISSLKDLGIAMPNPMTQDQFSSFINPNQFDAAKAYDFLGQEQNINSVNKGVYVLRLTKNNKMYTGKISIQ